MRLWNVNDGTNTFVNYDKVVNSSKTCNTIAISSNGQLVYHPSGNFDFGKQVKE